MHSDRRWILRGIVKWFAALHLVLGALLGSLCILFVFAGAKVAGPLGVVLTTPVCIAGVVAGSLNVVLGASVLLVDSYLREMAEGTTHLLALGQAIQRDVVMMDERVGKIESKARRM